MNKPCLLCHSSDTEFLHRIEDSTVHQCLTCGCGFTHHSTDTAEQSLDYGEAYYQNNYLSQSEKYVAQAQELIKSVPALANPGRLLDYGCGPGIFLNELKKEGWEVHGIDDSHAAIKYAKESYRLNLKTPQDLDSFPANHFDLMLFLDVLPCLTEPINTLKKILTHLKSGGVIIVKSPDRKPFYLKNCRLISRWKPGVAGTLLNHPRTRVQYNQTAIRFLADKLECHLLSWHPFQANANPCHHLRKGSLKEFLVYGFQSLLTKASGTRSHFIAVLEKKN